MSDDLIKKRVLREFRDLCAKWGTVAKVRTAFESEDFVRGPRSTSRGERRGEFDAYANVIDWCDGTQVVRALRVLEEIWSWGESSDPELRATILTKLRRLLAHDGYELNDLGRIQQDFRSRFSELPTAHLNDSASLEEHLARLDPGDPHSPSAPLRL